MIGYAAASQSAQAVSALLGGPPASDRRVQDQLNELLASKSRPELWEVLRLLKEFLGGDRAAASQYFAERPGLTKAVFQAQVLLGEFRSAGATRWCSLMVCFMQDWQRLRLGAQRRQVWRGEMQQHRFCHVRGSMEQQATVDRSIVACSHWQQLRHLWPPNQYRILYALALPSLSAPSIVLIADPAD